MRGKGDDVVYGLGRVRITPAYAGKSSPSCCGSWRCMDHPRVCGEKATKQLHLIHRSGSPPRMRGKADNTLRIVFRAGITPAYAEKRQERPRQQTSNKDHPRVCGEKSVTVIAPSCRPRVQRSRYRNVIRSFTCGSACRSGRIMPGISSISVSSAHNGHQPKAIGLAAPHALTQQCPELFCIGHL